MESRYVEPPINRTTSDFEQQTMTVTPASDYFEIYGIRYSRSQLPIQNAYALTVHKTQSSTLSDIAVSLDSTMFARGHAYTAMSRAQEFKQVGIVALCQEAFKVDKETVRVYERLREKYDDIIQRRVI